MEALQESVYLRFDRCGHPHLGDELDVLGFVFLRHGDVLAAFLELDDLQRAKVVDLCAEGEVQHGGVVVQDPPKVLVVLRVDGFHITRLC